MFEFDSSSEIKGHDQTATADKHLAKPSIYLNVCKSDKVKGPLDRDREYADPQDDKTWAILPVSYAKESETDDMIVYDAHVNSDIIDKGIKDKRVMNSVLLVILKRFEQLMINKYRLDIKNVHILSDKKYKSGDFNKVKPSLHLLMPDCDPKMHKEYRERVKLLEQPTVKMPTRVPTQEEDKDENLSAEDLLKKLNMPSQTSSSSTKPKVVEVTDSLPSKSAYSSTASKPQAKPVKKGETQIKETVIKSIEDYNAEEERK